MKSESSLTIFDYIREINKLPAEILSPAKFKILVEIAMQIAESGKSSIKNKELSIKTAIRPSSIKVLISQLKKDGFIQIEKINGLRTINLPNRICEKRLMVINQTSEKVNGDLPFSAPPYINNVVVVLLAKHGYEFGPATLKKLAEFSEQDQIRAIESTARNSKTNPEMYLNRILENGCKGIKLTDNQSNIDPYRADRERIAQHRLNTKKALDLGFKPAGYTIQ